MRGRQGPQVTLLAFIDLETRVPSDLRWTRKTGQMVKWESCS